MPPEKRRVLCQCKLMHKIPYTRRLDCNHNMNTETQQMHFMHQTWKSHIPASMQINGTMAHVPGAFHVKRHHCNWCSGGVSRRDTFHATLRNMSKYPPPPLQSPGVARDGLPGGGGGDGHQVTVSRGGGGGDCKGISRQTVVPSTDASKENTCEATFALMRCQCVSSNTNVIEDPKER